MFVFVFFSVYFVFYGVNKKKKKKCLLSNSTAVDDGYSSFSIQRFQPCQLKKLNKGGLWRAPKAWASTYRGPGACSSAKNFKICVSKMPFPAFWDHEWTQTLHWRSRQSSALLRPKLWQAHARMPEKGKNGKQSSRKDWLNKERENFKNRENIEREREVSGQDGRFGISGYRQW